MKKIWSFIATVCFFSTIGNSTLIKPHIDEFLLRHYPQQTKAVIIDELLEYHHPSYIYMFKIDGEEYKNSEYKNNAANSTLKVGDTIEIKYYKYNPAINTLLHFKNHI
ncbi:hypothetical protein [uncultured Mucilaginibacter sp.]|uniref:hypothetical protein n=1 Tax=uncultured Mucilaginibacter sp. TaxID=797541 RepID=UPI00262E4724|nr:hypothetical protein [uncultured Mucilaginibacter sp.]